jgi:hypothetical protein
MCGEGVIASSASAHLSASFTRQLPALRFVERIEPSALQLVPPQWIAPGSRSRCPVGAKKHNFGPSRQARHWPTQENVDFFAGRPPLDRALSQAV